MDILKVKQNGVWTTIPAIIGPRGIGITSITKTGTSGLTDTYTITFSDNTTTTFTLNNGAVPNLTIGTVTEGATAAATITGTAVAPILNLVLPNANVPTRVSQLENDSNYAVDANYVHTDNNYTNDEKIKLSTIAAGAEVNVNADWNAVSGDAQILNKPTNVSDFTNDAGYLTQHQDISGKVDKITGKGLSTNDFTDAYKTKLDNALTSFTETDPTVPAWAKAAQKPTYTAAEVGAPTVAEMNQAIANVNTMKIHICTAQEYNSETGVPTIQNPDTQTFYLVPGGEGSNLFIEWAYVNSAWERFGSADVEVPVTDVQINGSSIISTGIANIPVAGTTASNIGVVWTYGGSRGISVDNTGQLLINPATSNNIKTGTNTYKPIVSSNQHESAFYGLAKAAGDSTQSASSNAVGTYTAEAKTAIQTMLDVPAKEDIPTKVSDLTDDSGHYTKPVGGIPASDLAAGVIPEVPVTDVQVNGTSVLSNGVANIPVAGTNTNGVIKVKNGTAQEAVANGGSVLVNGVLYYTGTTDESALRYGYDQGALISTSCQHKSTFYGLAKAAGVAGTDVGQVGAYTETSKTAIKAMLGVQDGLRVVRLI